jgi:[ribosomal protein S5]-alanine N-acetyltransferase
MDHAQTELHTARLVLRAPDVALADAVADFYVRNAAHLAPWDPPLPADHASPEQVHRALVDGAEAFAAGRSLRWWLCPGDGPQRVVGSTHVSSLLRGAMQGANLGYALDSRLQGRGLMHEALNAVIAEVFSPRVNLHRLQAGVQPENARSAAVLRRLGFGQIGIARRYLFIAGAWRDHLLYERLNPDFVAPPEWRSPTR